MAKSAAEVSLPAVLDEIVARLVDCFHPARIYLFGSWARGEAREESDFDLLIVLESLGESDIELATQVYRGFRDFPYAIDPVFWSLEHFERRKVVPASLPATVEREGILVYAA